MASTQDDMCRMAFLEAVDASHDELVAFADYPLDRLLDTFAERKGLANRMDLAEALKDSHPSAKERLEALKRPGHLTPNDMRTLGSYVRGRATTGAQPMMRPRTSKPKTSTFTKHLSALTGPRGTTHA